MTETENNLEHHSKEEEGVFNKTCKPGGSRCSPEVMQKAFEMTSSMKKKTKKCSCLGQRRVLGRLRKVFCRVKRQIYFSSRDNA